MIRRIDDTDREFCDPTPQEIRERAAEIRKKWSPRVAQRRRVSADSKWLPPLVLAIDLVRELNARSE